MRTLDATAVDRQALFGLALEEAGRCRLHRRPLERECKEQHRSDPGEPLDDPLLAGG